MKRLLIIGAGGYVSAIVLPTLKKHFKDIDITVLSKRPSNTKTVAAKNSVNELRSIEDIDTYDLYFLAIPAVEYEYFLKLIPKDKPLWIEKPLSEATHKHFDSVTSELEKFTSNIYVGFNKREVVSDIQIPVAGISGELSMKIYYDESMKKSLWQQFMLEGGIYYADGIHVIDLALFILGSDASIELLVRTEDLWRFDVRSSKGVLIVEVGNAANDLIEINSHVNKDFVNYTHSLKFFKSSFSKCIQG